MQPDQGQGQQTANGHRDDQQARQAVVSQLAGSSAGSGRAPAAGTAGSGSSPAGRKTFRLPGALIAWWAWVALGLACLIDVAISSRSHASAEIAVTVLLITGVMYTCALRPKVVTDADSITVRNPLRAHRIPWGSVTEVDMAESVRVHYLPEPGAPHDKVIHSWALYAQRRARVRMELMQQGGTRRMPRSPFSAVSPFASGAPGGTPSGSPPVPTAQLMCTQLSELANEARARGAAAGPREVTWAWQSAAAILAPALALVLVITLTR
jgi:hypothetical protein